MERRFLAQPRAGVKLETRDDQSTPTIAGYAAVYYDGTRTTEYELWPGVVERIMPGAFDDVLARSDTDARGLFNHNPDNLLARQSASTLRLTVDKVGLAYGIDPGNTTTGRDVTEHVRRGDLQGSSFAFTVGEETWKEEKTDDDYTIEVREITAIGELFDVGPVTYPAYETTTTGLRDAADAIEARTAYDAWKSQRVEAARQAAARRIEMGIRMAEVENV